jgi:hypothetical protein
MAADDKRIDDIIDKIGDLRIDVGVIQNDLSYLKTGMTDLRKQLDRNAEVAASESTRTRDLVVGGRTVKYVVGMIFALIGGVYAARETLKELIQSWLIK